MKKLCNGCAKQGRESWMDVVIGKNEMGTWVDCSTCGSTGLIPKDKRRKSDIAINWYNKDVGDM